jgi:DNA-binding MarR family transcriptional regulator
VSPAQLSGLVERLGERGWLAGRRPLHDRRRQYWQTTPVGAALLAQVVADLAGRSTQLAEALSEAERGALQSELERLATAVTDGTTTRQEAA